MSPNLQVLVVPCLADNYAYVLARPGSSKALVVDPAEADPVLATLEQAGLELTAVLCTHHHYDHVGGIETLISRFPTLQVYAHSSDSDGARVVCQTHSLEHGAQLEAAGLAFTALHVPGHTLGGMAYVIEDAVFTGDTLFVAGCGRLFEGTATMMHDSLCNKLGTLPPQTRVYCGHEYTVSNLHFALSAEPSNDAVREKLTWAEEQNRQGLATVPSTIADELATNPFMRCAEETLRARFGDPTSTPAEVLAAVRSAKDRA